LDERRWAGADILLSFHPNGGTLAAVTVAPDVAALLLKRGWLKMNGRRAEIIEQYPGTNRDGSVCLRIQFDAPYPRYVDPQRPGTT
jgi:hypothetical protein